MQVKPYEYKTLRIIPFQLGPINNNTYVLADTEAKQCVVVDPSYSFNEVMDFIQKEGWQLQAIWLTHAHFDHILGASVADTFDPPIPIAMHPADEILRVRGGSGSPATAGMKQYCPTPQIQLADGMTLTIGGYAFKVLHTPGHAPGHCCFYNAEAGWTLTGDLIFYHDYGRTDLLGGDTDTLMRSIKEKILTLPDETILFPGHEDLTTVGEERKFYR